MGTFKLPLQAKEEVLSPLAVHSRSLFHGTLAQVFGWLIIELNWETILTEK